MSKIGAAGRVEHGKTPVRANVEKHVKAVDKWSKTNKKSLITGNPL